MKDTVLTMESNAYGNNRVFPVFTNQSTAYDLAKSGFSLNFRAARYQIPLSLPVIFSPKAAAVASHGKRLSRAVLRSLPWRMSVVSSEA